MFELHEKTDYVDLGFNVQVLAVAVSKVRAYVEQERIARRATPANPKNSEELPDTMIQLIHQAIEKRHSSICKNTLLFCCCSCIDRRLFLQRTFVLHISIVRAPRLR